MFPRKRPGRYEQDRDPLENHPRAALREPAYYAPVRFIYQSLMCATAGHLIAEVTA